MAGLKSSEKRLLTMFGLALFVVANIIGDGIFRGRKKQANAAIDNHTANIEEFKLLLPQRDKVAAQGAWITARQPGFVSEEAAATEIENHVTSCANAAGATIDSSKPTEPVQLDHGAMQVALNVNVSGSPEDVTRFVSLLQTREGFYAVPSVTYTTDRRDNTILRCAATVARWYALNPTSSNPAGAGGGLAARTSN